MGFSKGNLRVYVYLVYVNQYSRQYSKGFGGKKEGKTMGSGDIP